MMAARPGGRAGVRTPALVLLVIVCGILPSLLTGALAVQIRQDLGMGPAAVGLATSYFFGAGALGSLLLGRLTERIGPAAALRLAALLSMCSSLGIAAAATTASRLFLFLAVSGFANAVAHPAANVALLDAVDPSRYGLVFGIKQSAVPVAALFAGAAVPAIALTIGWRYAFVAGGVVSLVVGALIPLVIAKTKMTERREKVVRRLTVGRGPMATLTIAAGLASMASNSLGMFLVLSAIDAGLGIASAGILLSVSSGLGIAVRVITGWLADRVGQGRLTAVAVLILTGAVGFGLLAIPAPLRRSWAVLWALRSDGDGRVCSTWRWHAQIPTPRRPRPA